MPTVKITDATVEPITLAEAKLHLRVDTPDEDALITALIKAVRLACETECNRTLITTTWELVVDAFRGELRLAWPKILAVESVKYIDTNGVEQTLPSADYLLDKESEPGRLVPAYGKVWPTPRCQANAVRVRYTAGFGPAAADVPENLKLWMKLHLAHYFRHREAAFAGAIQALPFAGGLLDPHRVWVV